MPTVLNLKKPEHGDIRLTHSIETSVDIETYDDTVSGWRWIGHLRSLYQSSTLTILFTSSDETVRRMYSSLVAAIDDLQSRGHRRML